MFDTNDFFKPGRLSIVLDGTYGSSGKGCLASFVCEYADNWQFACNTFSAQAGHWVRLDDGRTFFYQTFNSCAYADKFEKLYTGPDAAIELKAVFREIEENNIKSHKIGIHPLTTVIQKKDEEYERGEVDFEGNRHTQLADGTKRFGSTCHGTAPARVRKMLRRSDTLLAKDIPELKSFICDVPSEIMDRLDHGQSGIMEIAQGFPLSLNLQRFYPSCTNRNVTVSAALDGMMLPPVYAGNVFLNFRTYPIRISSYKYIGDGGKFLTWSEILEYDELGKSYEIYRGDSGSWYPDQTELTWEDITKLSGSSKQIMELTSVTKLPRRVATFSKMLMRDAIRYNRTGSETWISVNFMNYIDHSISGMRGNVDKLTDKCRNWLYENILPVCDELNVTLKCIGTGARTSDKIIWAK